MSSPQRRFLVQLALLAVARRTDFGNITLVRSLSKLALLIGTRIPRGHSHLLRWAAQLDPALRSYRFNPKELRGLSLHADFRDSLYVTILRHGRIPHTSDWLERVLREFAKPGSLVFDIGANIGYVSLMIHLHVPGAQIHAFEPGQRALKSLRANLGQIPNAKIHPLAISDTEGSVSFVETDRTQLAYVSNAPSAAAVSVPSTTVDRMSVNIGFPDFVKIDVEGYEHAVLRGMSRTISERTPTILFEALDDEVLEATCNLLRELSGGAYRVVPAGSARRNFVALASDETV